MNSNCRHMLNQQFSCHLCIWLPWVLIQEWIQDDRCEWDWQWCDPNREILQAIQRNQEDTGTSIFGHPSTNGLVCRIISTFQRLEHFMAFTSCLQAIASMLAIPVWKFFLLSDYSFTPSCMTFPSWNTYIWVVIFPEVDNENKRGQNNGRMKIEHQGGNSESYEPKHHWFWFFKFCGIK